MTSAPSALFNGDAVCEWQSNPIGEYGRDDHMNQDSETAATLRSKIDVHRPAVAMAAHNPLAAKLAAGAGFDAIWGCSAAISMRPATVRMGIRHRGNGMIVAA